MRLVLNLSICKVILLASNVNSWSLIYLSVVILCSIHVTGHRCIGNCLFLVPDTWRNEIRIGLYVPVDILAEELWIHQNNDYILT